MKRNLAERKYIRKLNQPNDMEYGKEDIDAT